MLVRLGQFTVRKRRIILIASIILFAIAGAIGGGVADHLSSGGFDDPGAESTRARQVVDEVFHGGQAEVFRQIGDTVKDDLAQAESVAIPITLLLLVVVFGSVVAAGLPVGIGVLSIIATFLVLRVVAELTTVSIFALNLTTAMGL